MRKTSNKENYPKNTHNIPSPTLKKAEISRPVAHKSQKRSPLKTSCPKPLAAHKSPIDRERKFMQRQLAHLKTEVKQMRKEVDRIKEHYYAATITSQSSPRRISKVYHEDRDNQFQMIPMIKPKRDMVFPLEDLLRSNNPQGKQGTKQIATPNTINTLSISDQFQSCSGSRQYQQEDYTKSGRRRGDHTNYYLDYYLKN